MAADLIIRQTVESDVDRILEIYTPFVLDHWTSFEEEVPKPTAMWERILRTMPDYPWLTARVGASMVGYAYAGRHRQRAAYRWACEVSVYVDNDAYRRGIGKQLYKTLFTILRHQGFRLALAGVVLPNAPSLSFHRDLGFESVGVYRNVGFKLGAWRDVCWMQKELLPPDSDPQLPIPFSKLPGSVLREVLGQNKNG